MKKMLNKIETKYRISYEKMGNLTSYPFEKEYQKTYKQNFLSKLKNQKILDLNIKNLSEQKGYNNNFETSRNSDNKYSYMTLTPQNKLKLKSINNKGENNEQKILNKIFSDTIKFKYSDLPFFSITKKKINLSEDEETNKKLLKEDFIYRISHGDRFSFNNDFNNFNKNKSIKKGLTKNYLNNQNISNKILPDLELKLNINNFTDKKKKQIFLTSKEKYILFVKNKLNDLKSGNIFKNLEKDISNFNEEKNPTQNKEKDKKSLNIKNNLNKEKDANKLNITDNRKILKKAKSCIEKKVFNNKTVNTYIIDKNFSFNNNTKKPLKYPINFYLNKQLEIKKKRYEKQHKEGWKEFKRKINLRNLAYYSNKNSKNPLILCVLEPNRDLQKKKLTNKMIYMRESKIRDLLISQKLKYDYSKDDIKRLLNGKPPMKDFEVINKDDENEKNINSKTIYHKDKININHK